ncbi:MAG: squalene/phytoene synthase family protein [Novosphingobium sp.]|nr:squalene/phytoene synthase family protein [Novosphingobium sp.]
MNGLLDTLPTLQRLALAYAPSGAREATLALLALDARLADIVRSASEPMLAQIRLAWWRDMLARDCGERPDGEPLLQALICWQGQESALIALVDGWEHLVADQQLGSEDMLAFCQGRGSAFAGLAGLIDCHDAREVARKAAESWTVADLAKRLQDQREKEAVKSLIGGQDWRRIALPRKLRPLAVLHGLALRDLRKGIARQESGLSMLFVAMRIGLSGR